jgi:MFS family permease
MHRVRGTFNAFPRQFWILVGAAFIDRLGGALLFPFFTLYITQKFDVGMTEVGTLFALFSLSGVVGSIMGGALADRLGRKGMLLFGLVMSALTSLLMGFVDTLALFFVVTVVVGLLANAGGPAQQAMVADLLPAEKRAEGFGILRVVANLSFTIGPMIGGLLATQSYLLLFIADATTSLITAVIVVFTIQETLPTSEFIEEETVAQTLGGYSVALRDMAFVAFLGASILMVMVYMQLNTTLAVYLRDVHGVNERGFGYLLSLNAAMVVLFQFPITRWVGRFRPLMVMAAGTLLYAFGFALYGFVTTYLFFLVAIAIVTLGEMMVSPVGQSIVARMAPDAMRGRYMAAYGFSWVIPTAFGPLLAGLVMDNADPRWVWYGAGVTGVAAALGFYLLELRARRSPWHTVDERLRVLEKLEEGQISAVEAETLLEGIREETWARLAPDGLNDGARAQRFLRVRISDPVSGMMRSDLRLPLALVNFVLAAGGELGGELGDLDPSALKSFVTDGSDQAVIQGSGESGDPHIEVSIEEQQGED